MNAHEQIMFQCGIEKQIRKEHGGPLSKACRAEIYLKSYTRSSPPKSFSFRETTKQQQTTISNSCSN